MASEPVGVDLDATDAYGAFKEREKAELVQLRDEVVRLRAESAAKDTELTAEWAKLEHWILRATTAETKTTRLRAALTDLIVWAHGHVPERHIENARRELGSS